MKESSGGDDATQRDEALLPEKTLPSLPLSLFPSLSGSVERVRVIERERERKK